MDTNKCAFSHTLVADSFGCSRAISVTQRDGPHSVCTDAGAARRCAAVFDAFKQAALPAFEVPDDLTQMPHSIPVKIQFGGLLGLQQAVHGKAVERIADIDALIDAALRHYGDSTRIPGNDFVAAMIAHRVKRRGGT